MRNELKKTVSGILCDASMVVEALAKNGPIHKLTHVNPVEMAERIDRVVLAVEVYNESRIVLRGKKNAFDDAVLRSRKLIRVCRDVISAKTDGDAKQLAAAGFEGSLAVPRNYAMIAQVMRGLSNYFTDHPDHEVASLEATLGNVSELLNHFSVTRAAWIAQAAEVRRLMNDRDAQAKLLRRDIQMVLAEMRYKVHPLHEVYEAFGFKRPGLQEKPEEPQNLTVANLIPEAPEVKWERPPRARYYHVWIKVVGVDADFRLFGTRRNCDVLFKELPKNAEVEVAVSALNSGGESVRSLAVRFTTGVIAAASA